MFVNSSEGQVVVQELSKRLVSQLAPEELEMFDELYAEYRANPVPPVNVDNNDPLGFGITDIVAVVTPAAGAAASATVAYLASEIIKSAKDESAAVIQGKIKALFNPEKKKPQADPDPSPLSKELLEQIKKLAVKSARSQGLSPKKAEQIALALVGQLVLSG
jgi:hypothetical protein